MGHSLRPRGVALAWWNRFALAASFVAVLVFVGCNDSSNERKVSSGLFEAPVTETGTVGQPGGVQTLVDKVTILTPIDPTRLASEIRETQSAVTVLGELPSDEIVVYEGQSRAVLTVDLCDNPDDCLAAGAEPSQLHYNSNGLRIDQAQAPEAAIKTSADAIVLDNGWLLTIDARTRNIIAFRSVEPRQVTNDSGEEILLPYRSTLNPDNPNFGRGNGVVLSVPISGEGLRAAVGDDVVTRIFEIEPNKILVLFASLPSIHLIELEETTEERDWDLAVDSATGYDLQETPILVGTVKLFPDSSGALTAPFVPFSEIAARVTDNQLVSIDEYKPVTVPEDGSALMFDTETFTFFRVSLDRDNFDEVIGGTPELAITRTELFFVLREAAGISIDGALDISRSFYHETEPEICFMEEDTNNVLCYNYTKPPSSNPLSVDQSAVRVFIRSNAILNAIDPGGSTNAVITSTEPELIFASDDVKESRLAFDLGGRQLLSLSYETSNVVITANRDQIGFATLSTISDLTYTRPLDINRVRAFDAQSVSLLSIDLNYTAFPVSVR